MHLLVRICVHMKVHEYLCADFCGVHICVHVHSCVHMYGDVVAQCDHKCVDLVWSYACTPANAVTMSVCEYLHEHLQSCTCVTMCLHVRMCMRAYMYIHAHLCTCAHLRAHVHTYLHAMHMCAHVCTCPYLCKHLCMCPCVLTYLLAYVIGEPLFTLVKESGLAHTNLRICAHVRLMIRYTCRMYCTMYFDTCT